jgi:hypothetical protein
LLIRLRPRLRRRNVPRVPVFSPSFLLPSRATRRNPRPSPPRAPRALRRTRRRKLPRSVLYLVLADLLLMHFQTAAAATEAPKEEAAAPVAEAPVADKPVEEVPALAEPVKET